MTTHRTALRLKAGSALRALAVALAAGAALLCSRADASDARADSLFETAMSAYKMERWEDASNKLYEFMAAAPDDPRNDQAEYYVGRSHLFRKFLNKAIEEFSYLIDDFPTSNYATLALHDRAQCYLQTRQLDKAVEDMERVTKTAVKAYHGDQEAMLRQLYENQRGDVFWLAQYYLDNKKHDNAIAVYQRLPNTIEAFRCITNVYYSLGQFDKIREMIDTLEGQNRHEAFKFLMEFYGKSKAYNQLKDIFAKLLQEKDPTNLTDDLVWTGANSFRDIGEQHWNWAMRRISEFYPRLARNADYELARHNWSSMDYQDELELFVIKYRTGPDVNTVLRWKGIALERAGRAEEARKDYRRIGEPGLGHWYAAGTYDGQFAQKKDYKAAIREYIAIRTAYYSAEWAAMAQWRVGEIYRLLKETDNAVEAFRHIVKRFPALVMKEVYYGTQGHDALRAPDREYGPEAQLAIGDVLREAERHDDAIMEYRYLLSHFAKSIAASVGAYNTALCYEGKHESDTAVQVLKSVLRRYPATKAASDAHTHLETKYKIADTEVSDAIDFFGDTDIEGKYIKNFLEDPEKMKDKKK